MRTTGSKRRLPNWAIGLILIVVIALGSFVAYTKKLPWSNPYEVQAVFETAQNLRPKAPVRIAGVNVGEVTKVEHLTSDDPAIQAASDTSADTLPTDASSGQQAAVVTMSLKEEALPLHEDAQFQLRPRLFLEGNLFVDTKPGSPNADEVSEDHVFPVSQTSSSVQIDQVLTTLQSDVRANLQTFLDQFGNALIKYDGAEGLQEVYRSGTGAYKYTSQVNEALQGTRTHDLSGLIKNLDHVIAALDSNELALQDLVTNFRIVTGSFAAESASLEQAIAKLPDVLDAAKPAFANLNASFPALRAFAREALPGVRSTAPTLRVATPLIAQVRQLVSQRELRGLVADLRPTIPDLARLTANTKPLLDQFRRVSSCFNEVVIPWSNDSVDPQSAFYPHPVTGNVAEETASGLVGIGSESRSGDANGQYIRVQAGGGTNTILLPGQAPNDPGNPAVGLLDSPLLGGMPSVHGPGADSKKPRFRPGVECETQEPPDLAANGIEAGDAGIPDQTNPVDLDQVIQDLQDLLDTLFPRRAAAALQDQAEVVQEAQQAGDDQKADEESAKFQQMFQDYAKQAEKSGAYDPNQELGG